jgi:hypothetical protein
MGTIPIDHFQIDLHSIHRSVEVKVLSQNEMLEGSFAGDRSSDRAFGEGCHRERMAASLVEILRRHDNPSTWVTR